MIFRDWQSGILRSKLELKRVMLFSLFRWYSSTDVLAQHVRCNYSTHVPFLSPSLSLCLVACAHHVHRAGTLPPSTQLSREGRDTSCKERLVWWGQRGLWLSEEIHSYRHSDVYRGCVCIEEEVAIILGWGLSFDSCFDASMREESRDMAILSHLHLILSTVDRCRGQS